MKHLNLVRVCDHTFHFDRTNDFGVVVDLGMNKGEFSQWIATNTAARCYGAEPVPELFASLPRSERIVARRVAIGGEAGTKKLSIPDRLCASLSETGVVRGARQVDVEVVTLPSFIDTYGLASIDLLKVDIEGAEIDVLRSMKDDLFARIGQMTIEFHDFMKRSDAPSVRELLGKIKDQGFFVINFGRKNYTDVVCLNRRRFDIDLITAGGLYVHKYRKGIARMFRRGIMNRIEAP
jgi:FkbM family methyltransferase